MKEDFLYYVWQLQYFSKKALTTAQGETLIISHPGTRNNYAGPDFLNGCITIDNVIWHGHVEMHINASDWYAHQHQTDDAYENVILHVVWNYNRDIQRQDGTTMPTLVLKNSITLQLYQQYQRLVQNKAPIPCTKHLAKIPDFPKASMLDKALFQRLTHKNSLVYQLLADNKGGWEVTAYQLLAYTFGFKVNSSAFLDLAFNLPLKILVQHANNLLQLESLLLGQASLLPAKNEEREPYLTALKKEYHYLAHKYRLKIGSIRLSQWKFFRLRPANFPTIRIAQFAQLLHQHPNIFDLLVNTPMKLLYTKLAVTQSTYWRQHYRFTKQSKIKVPGLGKASVEHILINTVVPLLVAYGKAKDEKNYIDRAVSILQKLPAEHNAITRHWENVGIKAKNAFDSQALIELFNNFCTYKQCLSCHIGVSIMRKKADVC